LHKVEWTEDSLEDLKKIDTTIANRILNKIVWFPAHFKTITPEALSGDFAGMFKLRVGDWRVVYTTEGDIIVIQAIGHRKEIYK